MNHLHFLSQAMFYLGIPTTRAGTCVTSDDYVIRDIFYNGNPKNERCTIITRIAETFIRLEKSFKKSIFFI
jgi:uncharacterized protein YdiU (UPF0061 family)